MITSSCLLHPHFALGTLLIFGALNKIDKLLIVLIVPPTHHILFAGHPLMEHSMAFQTVSIPTQWTVEHRVILLIVTEDEAASGRRTPRPK